ncbi:hypothetical protein I6I18_03230 [Kytococcus sedentarius]|uniref:Uncharacterized protein n=1 Tax=Kytococcus sedentarius (strain ATCC 14392 / DSM 20547 / JCM 11482 / CCUG 33030 / NBRC 15357 / NCTC 11040 / CCM 314 / 541) TaxID=478801 RepID=C7NGM2_KYTSD|nr:hypothetical protein [Kytococcus sedentarius]ACV06130.1 hypothetical protein Ksed_10880 [Kytococcus sedentarius DSM 20547]QQB64488.1 hypothetical protein I6I18_03230 [Kytococcus sedentarius]STX12452.1 Uncharacterised protein [Kytococcus sedentarius]
MRLDHLEADLVQDSIDQLARRIGARFPDRSLHRVALRVRRLADEVEESADSSRLRIRWMRWVSGALALALAVATVLVALSVVSHLRAVGVLDTVSDVESLTSDLSATIWRKISLLP